MKIRTANCYLGVHLEYIEADFVLPSTVPDAAYSDNQTVLFPLQYTVATGHLATKVPKETTWDALVCPFSATG